MRTDDAIRSLAGRCVMVGVRGSRPEHDALKRDLDACALARCRAVVLFDRDVPSAGARNVESPDQLKDLIAHVRERLGPGTIVAIDQEGGRVQRLRAERGFLESPSATEFAAMPTETQKAHADALARQLADLGIDLNFAPCVDLAVDPASPVIAALGRSYSNDPDSVVRCARIVIDALRAHGVVPCVKHFPGHGSANADSHAELPDITRTWRDSVELAPFAAFADEGVAVMTAHVVHRGVDASNPASLSQAWTTGVLRQRLGFRGVVVTDSLDMRAIRDRFGAGEAAVRALAAGADLALDANNMPGKSRPCPAAEMADAIVRAIEDGVVSVDQLRASAARIEAISDPDARSRGPRPA